jgi:DNA-directed RNA polymerase subunit alpha
MGNITREFARDSKLNFNELDSLAKESLDQTNYYIFSQRFYAGSTLESIGKKFKKSRERIRQKEVEIIHTLQKRETNKELETKLIREYGSLISQITSLKSKTKIIKDYENKELPNKFNIKINELELSIRTYNCLKAAKIETVEDLVRKTELDMLQYPGFGRKCLSEICELLYKKDLCLGMHPEMYEEAASKYVVGKKDLDEIYKSAENLLNKILDTKIESAEFPKWCRTRIINTIKAENIETLRDLVKKEEWEIYTYPNLGKEGAETIKSIVKGYGLSFGMKFDKSEDNHSPEKH